MIFLSYHNVLVPSKSAHSLYTIQTSMDISRLGDVFFYAGRGDDKLDFRTLYGATLADYPSFHLKTASIGHKGLAGLEKRITIAKDILSLKDDKIAAYTTQPRPLKFFLSLKKAGFKIKVVLELHSETEKWDSNLFRNTDGIIFTSRALQNRLTEKFSISSAIPQRVFYHRIRMPFSKREGIPSLGKRGEGRLVEDAFCIGYIGGLEQWKGVDTIIDALRHLPSNITARFIGGQDDSADNRRLMDRARELGIEKRLMCTGRVSRESIGKMTGDIDVFILPLLESGKGSLPMKLFDYMYLGKPIIASDQKSIKEVLKEGVTALFFQPGSDKGLAEQVKIIMQNPSLGFELSENAYNSLESYTVEKWLGDMKTFLEII